MEIKIERCSCCGKNGYIIPSNNPLINNPICLDCINKVIDPTKLDHFAFFCRTYNLPLNANLYTACLKHNPSVAIKEYVENLYNNGTLTYSDSVVDQWKKVGEEWEKVKTHKQLLEKIDPIKKDFCERCGEKWGREYTFDQYLPNYQKLYQAIATNGWIAQSPIYELFLPTSFSPNDSPTYIVELKVKIKA